MVTACGRGGPHSIQWYSVEYQLFLNKNFIHIVYSKYMIQKKTKIILQTGLLRAQSSFGPKTTKQPCHRRPNSLTRPKNESIPPNPAPLGRSPDPLPALPSPAAPSSLARPRRRLAWPSPVAAAGCGLHRCRPPLVSPGSVRSSRPGAGAALQCRCAGAARPGAPAAARCHARSPAARGRPARSAHRAQRPGTHLSCPR